MCAAHLHPQAHALKVRCLVSLGLVYVTLAVQRPSAERKLMRRDHEAFVSNDDIAVHPSSASIIINVGANADTSLLQWEDPVKYLPASAFATGSSAIDARGEIASQGAQAQAPVLTTPAPVVTAAPQPAGAAVSASPQAVPALPQTAPSQQLPVTAPPPPAAAAAGATVATAAPQVAATPKTNSTATAAGAVAEESKGGSGVFFYVFMTLLIVAILLVVIFFVRMKMQRPTQQGRLDGVRADPSDSQFWKSAKARQSFRKSQLTTNQHSDAEDGASTQTGSGDKDDRSRDGTASRQDAKSVDERAEISSTRGGTASSSSYRERRERSSRERTTGDQSAAQDSASSPNTNGRGASPDGEDSGAGDKGSSSSYRGRRMNQ